MPSIILDRFGGMMPRLTNPRKLPKTNAQFAQDVDLTSGDLVPIAVEPPFQSLHETDGTLKGGLTGSDVIYTPAPPAVTETAQHYFATQQENFSTPDPVTGRWLQLDMYVWVTWVDASNNFQVTPVNTWSGTPGFRHTKDGIIVYGTISGSGTINTIADTGYTVRGPIFRFRFYQDEDYRGGPDSTYTFPTTADWTDPVVQQFTVPLTFPISMENFDATANGRGDGSGLDRFTYGFMEIIDYDVPRLEPEIVTSNNVTGYKIVDSGSTFAFRFRCNYTRDTQMISYYRQTYVNQEVAKGTLDTALTGTGITTIKINDPLTYGEADIPAVGLLHLERTSGLPQTVEYSAYVDSGTTHDFTVDSITVTGTFPADTSTVAVIDPTVDGREGPPSTESEVVTVDPGKFVELGIDNNDRFPKVNIYRSDGGGEDSTYRLLYEDAKFWISSGTPTVSGMTLSGTIYKGDEVESITVAHGSDPSALSFQGVLRLTDGGNVQEFRYTTRVITGAGPYTVVFGIEKETADYTFASSTVDGYDTETDTTYDRFVTALTTQMPEYGNFTNGDLATALEGSLRHPAGWGATVDGKKLRPSVIGEYQSMPEDYEIEFETNIMAAVISGGSIIVFTEDSSTEVGKVYEVVGNNPAYLAVYELSNGHPLLAVIGLAKIGQTIFWPTNDGIAATSGGSVQVITEKYFTREEWLPHSPHLMDAYTSENTLWLITVGEYNWRMDLDELASENPNIFLGTFTAFSGKPFVWDSKIFEFPRPIAFSCLRVDAEDYPVAVEFYTGAGELRHAELVMNDQVKKIKRMRLEREWYIRVHGTNTVHSVGVATNPQELAAYGA